MIRQPLRRPRARNSAMSTRPEGPVPAAHSGGIGVGAAIVNAERCTRGAGLAFALVLALTGLAPIAGCGSGSSTEPVANPPPPPVATPTTISGVASTGAAVSGATVTLVDASAGTADPAPVTTAADGSFSVDVSGLQAPFTVRVAGTSRGSPVTLFSVLASVTANSANTLNATPLTHAVAALIAPNGDPAALLAAAALAAAASSANVDNAVAALLHSLSAPSFTVALGIGFNPMTTPFSTNSAGINAVLEQLDIVVSAPGVRVVNLAAPVAESGAPTSVLLTPALLADPASAPTLPGSAAAADIPAAADIEAIREKLQACMALPLAQRVTLDPTGAVPTALAPACNFADPGYRSTGRNWVEDMGRLNGTQLNFSRSQLTNASFGSGAVVLALAPQGLTGALEFKHPNCNAGPCAVVRFPVTSSSGHTDGWDVMLGKVAGQWAIVGNQLPYELSLQAALSRFVAANTAANPGNPYFFKSRFESGLTFTFNPSGRNGNGVRAVRLKGPGLPAAGLVYHRSMRCGTDYRFPLTNQTGSLRNPSNSSVVTFNDGSGAVFILDAANLDGTSLALPVGTSTSPSPVANQASLIPAWTRYAAEIFLFSNVATPDSPDEVVYFRVNSAATNASEGASLAWPTMSQGFVDAYLTPTGSGAGVVTGGLTLAWTAPAGVTVLDGYLFRQDAQTLTNINGITASYTRRGLLGFEPAAYGDATAASTRLRSILSGASLVPETANAPPNPNPRCTDPSLVPVTGSSLNYYEAALSFKGPTRRAMSAVWFWDN